MGQNACYEHNYFQLIRSNTAAQRSCAAASVTSIKNKLVKFEALRKGLKEARAEFERDLQWEDWINTGLLATRWIKASCDGFISMAASGYDNLVGKGPVKVGALTQSSYSLAASVAEAGTQSVLGQNVDRLALVRDVKDGVLGMASAAGKLDAGAGKVSGIANLYVNIGIDSTRKDEARVLEQVAAGQLSEITKLTREWAKEINNAGAEKTTKGLDLAIDVLRAAYAFDVALTQANELYFKDQQQTELRRQTLRRALRSQLARLDQKITSLEAEIDSCFVVTDETMSTQPRQD